MILERTTWVEIITTSLLFYEVDEGFLHPSGGLPSQPILISVIFTILVHNYILFIKIVRYNEIGEILIKPLQWNVSVTYLFLRQPHCASCTPSIISFIEKLYFIIFSFLKWIINIMLVSVFSVFIQRSKMSTFNEISWFSSAAPYDSMNLGIWKNLHITEKMLHITEIPFPERNGFTSSHTYHLLWDWWNCIV